MVATDDGKLELLDQLHALATAHVAVVFFQLGLELISRLWGLRLINNEHQDLLHHSLLRCLRDSRLERKV